MATDATGTPTAKGIPKYNTASDAPSGLGFNATMDAIDALLTFIKVRKNSGGADVSRKRLNLIEGANVTLTVADDAGNDEVDVTIAASSAAAPGYATTLPGSPTDGQEAILVDSITLPTYQWRFRWNAGSSHTDKWEFVGGTPAFAEVATNENIDTSGSYVALATAGPSIVLPKAGVYDVEIGAEITTTTSDNSMSYDIGATGAVDADAFRLFDADAGDINIGQRKRRKTGLTAVTLTAKYKSNGTTSDFARRFMRVTPVRVS